MKISQNSAKLIQRLMFVAALILVFTGVPSIQID